MLEKMLLVKVPSQITNSHNKLGIVLGIRNIIYFNDNPK